MHVDEHGGQVLWAVSRNDGEDLGRVLQLNGLPAGVLARFYRDVACAAATEAGGGVRTVVANAGGFPTPPGAAPRGQGPQAGQGLAQRLD